MTAFAAANAIVALATLTALLVLFYGPWQAVCTEFARQFIFERRDKLFDMALAGRLAFDSEAYKASRTAFNGMLRFAHTLTWQEFVIGAAFIEKVKPKIPDWREALGETPADVRKDIDALMGECTAALIGMMALRSIFIGPLGFVLAIVIGCTKGTTWLLHSIASQQRLEPIGEKIRAASAEFAEAENISYAA
jgi:hypothetical protein